MGKRREAREAALQFLFGHDLRPDIGKAETDADSDAPVGVDPADRAAFWQLRPADPEVQRFGDEIVRGILENQEEIDTLLQEAAANYELNRITTVDRNILRIAIYEMLFREDIPPVVSINEAIEVAKTFGTEDSGRFVNGILDRVKKDLKRPLREPAPSQGPE